MGIATKIPQNTFDGLQVDAGVLLTTFDPADPVITDAAIICATTGGITVSCTPTYSDYGEDVDNCPNNTKELKRIDGWDCKFATTGLGTSLANIQLALGAADITAGSSKVTPRRQISQSDFSTIWWVGDRADGGLVAVKLINALSTGGFSLKTTKNGKGQISIELTGHVSISAQDVVPMEFYSLDAGSYYSVIQHLSHVTSNYTSNRAEASSSIVITLTAAEDYTIENVVVLLGGEDVTAATYDDSTGKVTITSVTGDVELTATATTT